MFSLGNINTELSTSAALTGLNPGLGSLNPGLGSLNPGPGTMTSIGGDFHSLHNGNFDTEPTNSQVVRADMKTRGSQKIFVGVQV